MKAYACLKCQDNQRKAGEALGLFNEAAGELLDDAALLREVEALLERLARVGRLSEDECDVLQRVRAAVEHAGERKRVENGIREIIATT